MLSRTIIIAAWCTIFFCTLCAAADAASPASDSTSADSNGAEIAATLERYYRWVLVNSEVVAKDAPRLVDVPGTTRFYLDRSSENQFIDGFMNSGNFSSEFALAVARYYAKYEKEFSAFTPAEFDQMAHDGRGPMMDVEDMDIFFCAQEYEYKDEYIQSIRLKELEINGDTASVVTIFPFEWETPFKLKKIDGKWLISAFCVYQ